MNVKSTEDRHSAGTYAKRDLVLVRGKGALVFDEEGRPYIDCTSGVGVASLGHANRQVIDAIAHQAERMITCYELFYNDARARFYEALSQLMPAGLDRFFLCNSGTEAVEAALKFARKVTGKHGVLAMQGGYHGKTLGSLSATWNPRYRRGFEPLLDGFQHVPFNNVGAVEQAFRKNGESIGAVVLELVQGESGVKLATPEFVRTVRRLCDQYSALLIIDEIQTGLGRTGKFFACEHYGVIPDILTLAKAIGGGLPMGVVALGGRVRELGKGSHTSTFGGNPLVCAAGRAFIEQMIEERLPEQARQKGAYLLDQFRRISSRRVREVRGLGLMLGIELRERAQAYVSALMKEGVLALLAGPTVIRFLPPLIISRDEMDQVVGAVRKVLGGESSAVEGAV